MSSTKQLVIDIDGILFEETNDWDYLSRKPITKNINIIKTLAKKYDITLYTSRRSIDSFWITIQQIEEIGLRNKIKRIIFDKPLGLFYIDDKAFNNIEDIT